MYEPFYKPSQARSCSYCVIELLNLKNPNHMPPELVFVCCGFHSFFYPAPLDFRLPKKAKRLWCFTGAKVIDGAGHAPVEDAVLVVQADKISAIGPSSSVSYPNVRK
jgi:hypothetical protein